MVAEICRTGLCTCPARVWTYVEARQPFNRREVDATSCSVNQASGFVLRLLSGPTLIGRRASCGLPSRGLPDRLVVHLKNEAAGGVRRFQFIERTIGLVERKAPGM